MLYLSKQVLTDLRTLEAEKRLPKTIRRAGRLVALVARSRCRSFFEGLVASCRRCRRVRRVRANPQEAQDRRQQQYRETCARPLTLSHAHPHEGGSDSAFQRAPCSPYFLISRGNVGSLGAIASMLFFLLTSAGSIPWNCLIEQISRSSQHRMLLVV